MSKIADDILDILGECRTEGNTLFLPDRQLERSTYQAVNKVLESIGGKWNRKAKGYVFADGDPAELLDNVILAGEITDLKKQYQFFPTPRPVAEKMCELAELDATCIVLEPSCGKGDLADVVFEAGVKELTGLELNRDMEKHLTGKPYKTLVGMDFLEFAKDAGEIWTRIVMNPPFSRQQDIDHILTAYSILRPGGILVSVVSESPFFRSNKKSVDFRAFLEEREAVIVPIEEGAFKESGTMVRTRLVKIVKPLGKEESPKGKSEVKVPPPAQKHSATSKAGFPINDRCPLQSECERKRCDYKFQERECSYYQGNARPGAEIEDQAETMDAEWEEKVLASLLEEGADEEASPAPPQEPEKSITPTAPDPSGLMMPLPVDKLIPHPDNPRKDLGDLTELADSIKANGIFQNLTVVPVDETYETFTVVIGHRRLAAAKLAGLKEVPCVIASMDAKEQVRTMLLENMQRSDLTVYEQAQGFQMMLDMGDSVEDIAAKSGFSKTTVRRRVKMLELDQGTLKAVSERQLSLTDFDELAKIEDAKARNACLVEIGTANFNQSVTTQLRQQAIKKRLPAIKKQLKSSKAKALKQSDTWSGKYESLNAEIIIPDWDGESRVIPEKVSGQLYYYLDESWGRLRFFQKRQKPAPVKRPAAEIAKEKRIAAAWAGINEKAAITYQMRSEFVHSLTWGKKTSATILQGALIAGVLKTVDYMSSDREAMEKALGLEEKTSYSSDRGIKALAALQKLDVKQIASAIYALFDDSKKENYASGFRGAYPGYAKSTKLDGLYLWLTSLGYQMSDEEKALQDGTHELYHMKESEEKAPAPSVAEADQERKGEAT